MQNQGTQMSISSKNAKNLKNIGSKMKLFFITFKLCDRWKTERVLISWKSKKDYMTEMVKKWDPKRTWSKSFQTKPMYESSINVALSVRLFLWSLTVKNPSRMCLGANIRLVEFAVRRRGICCPSSYKNGLYTLPPNTKNFHPFYTKRSWQRKAFYISVQRGEAGLVHK